MKKKAIISIGLVLFLLISPVVTVCILSNTSKTLSNTVFASFDDYKDSYNTCAFFIKALADDGTLKDGDSVWYYPDTVILGQGTGDKYSKYVKTDITDTVDSNIISEFNRLYEYIPSVNRVLIYKNDIRFVQPEEDDIYEKLIFTFNGKKPDIFENATDYFYYTEYCKPRKVSENWYLISRSNVIFNWQTH